MSQNKSYDNAPAEESFSIKDLLAACVAKWKWFLLSIIVFTAIGVVQVYRMQPVYQRSMAVLIKDPNSGGMSDIASSFSSFGFMSSNPNVYNEMISLLSPDVMADVVQRLNLEVNYSLAGFPHATTLYGSNQPFMAKFLDFDDKSSGSFNMELHPDGSAVLSKFVKGSVNGVEKFDKVIKMPAGAEIVKTPIGRIQFTPNQRYTGGPYTQNVNITVSHGGFLQTVEKYAGSIKGDLTDRDADVIDLSIKDVSIERADDILNTVLEVYTSKWIADKNKIATATSKFIDERLAVIESELGNVDADIMNYKSKTLAPDLQEAARLNLQVSHDMDSEILKMSSELTMAKYVSDYINNPANANNVIPVNVGVGSPQLENQINNYNTLLLTRNNIAKDASANNPIVADYDTQLRGMRESINRGVANHVASVQTNISNLEGAKGNVNGQLASAPKEAKYLLSVERQQKVKESLYLYLLQKREENELTQTFTADNTRVITPPYGKMRPVAPKKKVTVGIMFLLGLLLPAGIIYLRESSNNKIRSRKDLDRLSVPLIGEIPQIGKKTSLKKLVRRKKSSALETLPITVSAGRRDLANESFRILRGNLEMMSGKTKLVYLVTSFNPGSGKSFITYNIAASFAIKGQKTLIIDCDLRHGSTSQFVGMPSHGLTSYLTDKTDDWEKLVVKVKGQDNLSVLPIGRRPPNPAELLETPRMAELIARAREDYDVIFLDCPPVDVVVDTQVLSQYADRSLFVVRAGLFEKSAVNDINILYKECRFHQMGVILNGTEHQFSRYGSDNSGYYGSAYKADE